MSSIRSILSGQQNRRAPHKHNINWHHALGRCCCCCCTSRDVYTYFLLLLLNINRARDFTRPTLPRTRRTCVDLPPIQLAVVRSDYGSFALINFISFIITAAVAVGVSLLSPTWFDWLNFFPSPDDDDYYCHCFIGA